MDEHRLHYLLSVVESGREIQRGAAYEEIVKNFLTRPQFVGDEHSVRLSKAYQHAKELRDLLAVWPAVVEKPAASESPTCASCGSTTLTRCESCYLANSENARTTASEAPQASADEDTFAMELARKLMEREYPGGTNQQQNAIHVALLSAMTWARHADTNATPDAEVLSRDDAEELRHLARNAWGAPRQLRDIANRIEAAVSQRAAAGRKASAEPIGHVAVITDAKDGRCVAVTRQDEEGKILKVIWEAPLRKTDDAVKRLTDERDQIGEINHGQWLSLENIRLYAARHRKEEWAKTMLRFCEEAGSSASPYRGKGIETDDEATRLLLALCDSNDRRATTQAWRDAYKWRDRRKLYTLFKAPLTTASFTKMTESEMAGKSISEERREFTPERPEERASEDPDPAEPAPDSNPPEE